MICFNCEKFISDRQAKICPHCLSTINSTKLNFISYIGSPDSLMGYQRSYKLVLLKYIIENLNSNNEALVTTVIEGIKKFYLNRKKAGLIVDYNVDKRIADIESSSLNDVFSVIRVNPFRVINEQGYLFINNDSNGNPVFVFNEDISKSMSENEWGKLLKIINEKLDLYYNSIESKTDIMSKEVEDDNQSYISNEREDAEEPEILRFKGLSVRARNALARNNIFSINDLIEYKRKNQLFNIKNIGAKTYNEIENFLLSFNSEESELDVPNIETSSICSVFCENKFRLFVKYCNDNNINTIGDLKDFDFSDLINQPGLGIGKIIMIEEKYNSLTHNNVDEDNLNSDEINSNYSSVIEVDDSNYDVDINFLAYLGISRKICVKLYENGYKKIGQLKDISLSELTHIVGFTKIEEVIKKLSVLKNSFNSIVLESIDEIVRNREFNILSERASGKTLQKLADGCNLTRERVRQLECKMRNSLLPLFEYIIERLIDENKAKFVNAQDVFDVLGKDDIDTVLLYSIKSSDWIEYLSFAEIFIKKKIGDNDTLSTLDKVTKELIGDEGFNFKENVSQIEELLSDKGLGFISIDSYLNYLNDCGAKFYGEYVFLKEPRYVKVCLILINKYFKDGINLYDEKDIQLLRKYCESDFCDFLLPDSDRAISSRLSKILINCDRGRAKTIENVQFDLSVLEEIKEYIDNSELKTLYFTEIFSEFEGVLSFTSDITNYHGLHGVLSYLYGDEYSFHRDYLTKTNSQAIEMSLSERLIQCLKLNGGCITRKELENKFKGISNIMLYNAVNESSSLMQWEYNCFNTIENLKIYKDDIVEIKSFLEKTFLRFKGYCSDKYIYAYMIENYPEFLSRNKINNATNLFYVIQKIFSDYYQFSRPNICEKGSFESLNMKDIAISLMDNPDTFTTETILKMSKTLMWSESTTEFLFSDFEKEYIRVSKNLYVKKDNFVISNDHLNQISNWIENKLQDPDNYMSMIRYDDFEGLPDINYEWNTFLLISIIKLYPVETKIILPKVKDRRYNKAIIISSTNPANELSDIAVSLLRKNNIHFIDESTFRSFLILNNLIIDIIPKEIYGSTKLSYEEGCFSI